MGCFMHGILHCRFQAAVLQHRTVLLQYAVQWALLPDQWVYSYIRIQGQGFYIKGFMVQGRVQYHCCIQGHIWTLCRGEEKRLLHTAFHMHVIIQQSHTFVVIGFASVQCPCYTTSVLSNYNVINLSRFMVTKQQSLVQALLVLPAVAPVVVHYLILSVMDFSRYM